MTKYELAVIVSAKIEDDARAAAVDKCKALIERFGGQISDVDEWGKKKLAYEINKMNKVILMGRLTRDPDVRYSQGENSMAIARYTLAVDRRGRRDSQDAQTADFIGCVAFGRSGEFAEKYLKKGTKVVVTGRIQTGSYTNKDGQKVYTTDVVVEDHEFAESKNAAGNTGSFGGSQQAPFDAGNSSQDAGDGFINIPDGIDEELPFN